LNEHGREFALLHEAASAAVNLPASEETLTHVADIIATFAGVSQVFFTYAVDKDFIVCGDSRSGGYLGTSQVGLWLVQRQFDVFGGPVAFNIENGRVGDFAGADAACGRQHVAFKIPTSESPAEMLMIHGTWDGVIPRSLLKLIGAATPSLTLLLERMLNAARGDRQKEQLVALANAAELLTRSEDVRSALSELATAVAAMAELDYATIGIYAPGSQTVALTATNRTRFSALSLEKEWHHLLSSNEGLHEIGTWMATTREPFVAVDSQNDERLPEAARDFSRRSLLSSSISLPLLFGDELLGFLQSSSFTPQSFPPAQIAFMKGLAAQVATALKAMQIYKALAESEEQLRQYAQRLQTNMEIQHRLARTDVLTGIPNRRYVEEVIEAECARAIRGNSSLSVIMLDLDGLKRVNDAYGHPAGDEVLVQLAQLARRSCRRGDAVGRFGGDEFLFVLPASGLASGRRFGERFRARVERQEFRLLKGGTTEITVSLGVAEFSAEGGERPSRLIEIADSALYDAKSAGGNRVCVRPTARRAA
jgi:diguanylate cyclase (GGDEF)-like protein